MKMYILNQSVTLSATMDDNANIEFKLNDKVLSEEEIAEQVIEFGKDYITLHKGEYIDEELLEVLKGLYTIVEDG